jgi:oligopeptide transport system substrate-binding protein
MTRRRWLTVLVALIAVLVVAVIRVDTHDKRDSDTQRGTDRGSGRAEAREELRLLGDDPPSLDPALFAWGSSWPYLLELYSGLVTLTPDMKIAPDIARAWTVSDDGRTYTFTLRDDVTFSGSHRRVTAADVEYSLERAAAPETKSPGAAFLLGDIHGIADVRRGATAQISGITVADDLTFRITLDDPIADFLTKLANPTAFVVDQEQIRADPQNWERHPNGTGPYTLHEWSPGARIVLAANDSYYGNPKPRVSRVTYSLTLSDVSGLPQYENDDVDITRIRDRADRIGREKEFVEVTLLRLGFLALNTKLAPFDDVRVRQAFALAIDGQRFAGLQLRYGALLASTILAPGMPGYTAEQRGLGFDPERAKQLLADSTYGGRLPRIVLPLWFVPSAGNPFTEWLSWIVDMWREHLGATVEIEQVDIPTLNRQADTYQMLLGIWDPGYADPRTYLEVNFLSTSAGNIQRYANPRVDELLLRARTERAQEARMQIYREAEQIVLQDAVWIPLWHDQRGFLVKPYVKGWQPTAWPVPILKYVTLEP